MRRFDYEPADSYLDGVAVVSNAPGEAGFGAAISYWNGSATPWQMGINTDTGAEQSIYAYIYTDRPIYRPGDIVYYKGVVRDPNFGRYNLPDVDEMELNLGPAFYYGEETFTDVFPVTVDADGVFTGEYQLPEDLQLGTWSFYLTGDYWQSTRNFTVAEYRRPEFLVTVNGRPRGNCARRSSRRSPSTAPISLVHQPPVCPVTGMRTRTSTSRRSRPHRRLPSAIRLVSSMK